MYVTLVDSSWVVVASVLTGVDFIPLKFADYRVALHSGSGRVSYTPCPGSSLAPAPGFVSRGRTRAFARFPFREFRVLNLYRKVPQILVYREIFETRKPAHVYVRTFYVLFSAFFVFFDNIISRCVYIP